MLCTNPCMCTVFVKHEFLPDNVCGCGCDCIEAWGHLLCNSFFSLDEQPIAAASIAQVHRALLKDHQEVAVKVCLMSLIYNGLARSYSQSEFFV